MSAPFRAIHFKPPPEEVVEYAQTKQGGVTQAGSGAILAVQTRSRAVNSPAASAGGPGIVKGGKEET